MVLPKPPKLLIMTFILLRSLPGILAGESEFNRFVEQIESDVLALAKEVKRLYQNRCENDFLKSCSKSNYDDCASVYPNPVCTAGLDFDISRCGGTCSSIWDYTVSSLWLSDALLDPVNYYPKNPEVTETVCYTKSLDNFFIQKKNERQSDWDKFGVRIPQMYFGAENGVFRIYPGRPFGDDSKCGKFDCRLRPWYAVCIGPKNLVLMLDTSSSMKGKKLELMKDSAKQIIDRLTSADYIALVLFNSEATIIGEESKYLLEASKDNRKLLTDHIANITDNTLSKRNTNLTEAFNAAFQVLNDSTDEEGYSVQCTTAILFFTDGQWINPDITIAEASDLVRPEIEALWEKGLPVYLFTYSISENDENFSTLPKELACSVGGKGIWSKIVDANEISKSLTPYNRLFSLGLGQNNKPFVAWAKPYISYTGGVNVTTVSSPIYDDSVIPPLFLGVAAIDFTFTAAGAAGGIQYIDIERMTTMRSNASCLPVDLDACELEFFRKNGAAGDDALCSSRCNASDFVNMTQKNCKNYTEGLDLWDNRNAAGLSSRIRCCCEVGKRPSALPAQCAAQVDVPVPGGRVVNIAAVVGGPIGGLVGVLVIVYACIKCKLWQKMCRKLELWRVTRQVVILAPPYPDATAPPHPISLPFNPRYSE